MTTPVVSVLSLVVAEVSASDDVVWTWVVELSVWLVEVSAEVVDAALCEPDVVVASISVSPSSHPSEARVANSPALQRRFARVPFVP